MKYNKVEFVNNSVMKDSTLTNKEYAKNVTVPVILAVDPIKTSVILVEMVIS